MSNSPPLRTNCRQDKHIGNHWVWGSPWNYLQNGRPISYKISLVSLASNIGRGVVWFFLCPQTSKRCRKIYLLRERFLHREAFTGCMYEIQTVQNVCESRRKCLILFVLVTIFWPKWKNHTSNPITMVYRQSVLPKWLKQLKGLWRFTVALIAIEWNL